ncbi:hypothetical protein D3C72_1917370 [compost metagenome]
MPGIAKASNAPNSKAPCPLNSLRASSQAMSRPSAAVIGAEMPASFSVVISEFHAVPAHTSPNWPHSSAKALLKWLSVKL